MTHAQDRGLPLGANPQVPAIEQVVHAVLFRRDRVVVRRSDHFQPRRRELVAALGALVLAHDAGDDHGALLREVIGRLERLFGHVVPAHDDLQETGAVAQHEEVDLAARTPVVQPALDGDGLADVLADLVDVDVGHVQVPD